MKNHEMGGGNNSGDTGQNDWVDQFDAWNSGDSIDDIAEAESGGTETEPNDTNINKFDSEEELLEFNYGVGEYDEEAKAAKEKEIADAKEAVKNAIKEAKNEDDTETEVANNTAGANQTLQKSEDGTTEQVATSAATQSNTGRTKFTGRGLRGPGVGAYATAINEVNRRNYGNLVDSRSGNREFVSIDQLNRERAAMEQTMMQQVAAANQAVQAARAEAQNNNTENTEAGRENIPANAPENSDNTSANTANAQEDKEKAVLEKEYGKEMSEILTRPDAESHYTKEEIQAAWDKLTDEQKDTIRTASKEANSTVPKSEAIRNWIEQEQNSVN